MALAPVEYVIIEFPGEELGDEVAPALARLVDQGLVAILDLVVLKKAADGSVRWYEFDALDEAAAYARIEGAAGGLLPEADLDALGDTLAPGSAALCIVFEDRWAAELGTTIRAAGGRLVTGQRIDADTVAATLAALDDPADQEGPE